MANDYQDLLQMEREVLQLQVILDNLPTQQWATVNEKLREIRTTIQKLRMQRVQKEPSVVVADVDPRQLDDHFNVYIKRV